MQITSPAFSHQQPLPAKYTCDGNEISPPLNIEGIPAETKSLALILNDPDAPSGDFVHWVVFNIPPLVKEIEEGQTPPGVVGRNTLGTNAYVSPCPPSGEHRYTFKLYALDSMVDLPSSTTKDELLEAIRSHVITQTELIGLYAR
ncbi:MAG: YbhB/YbcL family Raf kinase inhibitor-like protein [Patescibacteria group bacterium]|jgi:hypothetical protein|nr:YbhB/YbcL family Raf kinase inhibitor-like protein [Patescibacteria group bacterium]